MTCKIAWIDVETTGLDPIEDGIWSLAGLIEIDGYVEREVELKMQPTARRPAHAEAIAKTGLDVTLLPGFQTTEKALAKLKRVLAKYVDKFDKDDKFIVAGYNVGFDVDMLRQAFEDVGDKYYGSWFFWPSRDVQGRVAEAIARCGLRLPNYQLSTVCEAFGIPIAAHNALSDIRATRMLWSALDSLK